MLWVLKWTVSPRRFIWAPTTYISFERYENIPIFTLKFWSSGNYHVLFMNRMISREKVSGKTESTINGVLEINSRSMGEELETNYNSLGQDWRGTRKDQASILLYHLLNLQQTTFFNFVSSNCNQLDIWGESQTIITSSFFFTNEDIQSVSTCMQKCKLRTTCCCKYRVFSHAREPLYLNSAVIMWWLQSTSAQNSVPSC